MKQILTKEMVKKALDDLKAEGKKTTNAMLYAALGQRGSMTTLMQLRAELEAEKLPPNDSDEGLKTFREVWALAKEEGRKQQESVIAELKTDREDLFQENGRLEGEKAAAVNQVEDARKAKAEIEAELARVKSRLAENQESLIQAGTATKSALEKLAAEQAAHHTTQVKLDEAKQKAHEFELDLVRCKAQLEALTGQLKKQDSSRSDRSATSSSRHGQSTEN